MFSRTMADRANRSEAIINVAMAALMIGAGWVVLYLTTAWTEPGAIGATPVASDAPSVQLAEVAKRAPSSQVASEASSHGVPDPVSLGEVLASVDPTPDVEAEDGEGDVAAEVQCRAIEAEVEERWDDGRLGEDDYDERWDNLLTDAEYDTVIVPVMGEERVVAEPGRSVEFESFADALATEQLSNDELIDGQDNCYEIGLFDFS